VMSHYKSLHEQVDRDMYLRERLALVRSITEASLLLSKYVNVSHIPSSMPNSVNAGPLIWPKIVVKSLLM
jgi:hypothetical protein